MAYILNTHSSNRNYKICHCGVAAAQNKVENIPEKKVLFRVYLCIIYNDPSTALSLFSSFLSSPHCHCCHNHSPPQSDHSFLIFFIEVHHFVLLYVVMILLCQWLWKWEALTLHFCDHLILFLFSGYHIFGSSCSFSFALFFFSLSTLWIKIWLLCCFWQTSLNILQRQMNLYLLKVGKLTSI